MTRLRDGRADLHDRLNAAVTIGPPWPEQALLNLLTEARDAVITCPVEGCAYCWTVEKEIR